MTSPGSKVQGRGRKRPEAFARPAVLLGAHVLLAATPFLPSAARSPGKSASCISLSCRHCASSDSCPLWPGPFSCCFLCPPTCHTWSDDSARLPLSASASKPLLGRRGSGVKFRLLSPGHEDRPFPVWPWPALLPCQGLLSATHFLQPTGSSVSLNVPLTRTHMCTHTSPDIWCTCPACQACSECFMYLISCLKQPAWWVLLLFPFS